MFGLRINSKCCHTELLIAQASTIMVAHRCHSFFYTKFYFTSYMTVSIKKVNEIAHQEPGRAAQLARVRKEMKIKVSRQKLRVEPKANPVLAETTLK